MARHSETETSPATPAAGGPDDRTRTDDRARPGDGRHETPEERSDRNWNELLQELRVTQTGVQILTGFLLTLPFQERFEDLDGYQRTLYLVLVLLAVLTTGLITAPVSLHRILFGRRLKRELVTSADRFARSGLLTLALTIAGAAMLVFDVVVGRTAGWVVGAAVLVLLAVFWLVYPLRVTRASGRDRGAGKSPRER
jgi:Family of unknown function (DUF6328)